MRFLVTMNMGSGSNNLVHQFVFDHKSESLEKFCSYLNEKNFILVTHYYWDKEKRGLRNMGQMIINVEHMGKVVEYTGGLSEVSDENKDQKRLTKTG